MWKALCGGAALGLLAIGGADAAPNEQDAAFFHAHPVSVMIGYAAGGGYDAYSRLIARVMPKYIPGNPSMVPQNMPGAGSLTLANYLYNIAPKDGTMFGIFGRGLTMAPLLGQPGTRYDAAKFTWIGSLASEVSVCVTAKDSPIKTWSDATSHDFTVGGEGSGSDPDVFATVMKNLFGVKLKLVSGYPGGNDILMGVERGEVDGRCGWSWSSMKSTRPSWISEKKVNFLVQLSLAKSPDLPDVPLITDFAKTDEQMQIVKLVFSRQLIAWPYVAPPDLPPARAEILRSAFDQTMQDPDFIAETKRLGLDLNPMKGTEVQRIITELYKTPADVVEKTRNAIVASTN